MDLLLKSKPASNRPRARARSHTIGIEDELASIEDLARLLDTRWEIPGLGVRFGVDAIAGLVPVVGDLATGVVSLYIVHRASELGASRLLIGRMVVNVLIDTVVGSVPLLGSLFDVYFKANRRNLRLLRRHLERHRPR
jgi:hypothetical protein